MLICQYCNKECKNKNSHTNHERTCPKNPDRKYKNGMTGKKGSNQFIKAKELGLPKPEYDRSHLPLSGCVTWSKEEWYKNVKGKVGGYRENAGRSKKFKVKDSFGNMTTLQSTYELKCSEILNELGIKWVRPKHLKYKDGKKYFADFYLCDYDIYLDPKNSYKAKLDEEKITSVMLYNDIKLFVLTEEKLNREYILMLVRPNGEGFD